MIRTGTQIMVQSLLDHGVDLVFGYPGGTILPFYDELSGYSNRITHVLTSHEQGAAHAADGYARVTGRVGVCIATSGLVPPTWSPASRQIIWIGTHGGHNRIAPAPSVHERIPGSGYTGITMPITKHKILMYGQSKLKSRWTLPSRWAKGRAVPARCS
jgi:acetolactate synthase-1/2/3 large subunit